MGKAEDLRAEYESKLAQAELEDQLVALKEKPATPANSRKLREVKDKLRQARYEERTAREGNA